MPYTTKSMVIGAALVGATVAGLGANFGGIGPSGAQAG